MIEHSELTARVIAHPVDSRLCLHSSLGRAVVVSHPSSKRLGPVLNLNLDLSARMALVPAKELLVSADWDTGEVVATPWNSGNRAWCARLGAARGVFVSGELCFVHLVQNTCEVLSVDDGHRVCALHGVRQVAANPLTGEFLSLGSELRYSPSFESATSRELIGAGEYTCAAWAEGFVFLGQSNGVLKCFDTQSGREVWRYCPPHPGTVFSSLVYCESAGMLVVIVSDRDGDLPARACFIDPRSGQIADAQPTPGNTAFYEVCCRGEWLVGAKRRFEIATRTWHDWDSDSVWSNELAD